MRRLLIAILTVFLLLQGSLPAVLAQDLEPTDGGNNLYIPAIPADPLSPTFSMPAREIGPDDLDFDMLPTAITQDGKMSYIVLMDAEPVIAYNGAIAGYSATKPQTGQRLNARSADAQAYSQLLKQQHTDTLAAASLAQNQQVEIVHHYTTALNGFSAIMTAEVADEVAKQNGVVSVIRDTMRFKTTNSSPAYLGLTKKGEAWKSGLTGEGVIVGIIDTGIWPEHPSFADDGSYTDLGIVLDNSRPNCEFGNTAQNPDDVPFTCNNKLLGARQMLDTYRSLIETEPFEYDSARDDDGHGTHTASTSAGNAEVTASMYDVDLGEISGIAPRARVIAYKGLGAGGGFTSDLAAAIDQAVFDGVDVINYSIGGGAALPNGADEIAFLFAADAGVFVATSAGNSGPGADTVGSPGNSPWLTTVAANSQPRFYEGEVKTTGGPRVTGASLTPRLGKTPFVDAEDFGNPLCLPDTFAPESLTGKVVLCERGASGRIAKGVAVADAGGIGMVLFNFDNNDNLFTDTHVVPAVHVNYTDGMKLKEYIDKQAARGRAAEVEIRRTGKETSDMTAPSITYFSSRGPNGPVPDIIKPDITAPGLQILAGDSPGVNAFGDSFMAIAGTSMSSPHVAGLFALLKQAHPDWSAAMARSAIMTTANTKVANEDRKTQATPFEMGAGEINPGRVDKAGSAFNPGLAYDAGLFEYAAFTCGADLGIFSPGSCAFLDSLGIPSDASDLNLASIGVAELAGSQTVVRTVTSVADETVKYKAKVNAPAGYRVAVSPNEFTIAPGDSVTLEVTITNQNAPVGEWRFGSLELKGKDYKVTSPIAVNGALFDAPSEVAGTGTSGSASFDVNFGYTGSYTAAPHGLVPSSVLASEIGQDPDQNYPSGDDAPGPAGGVDLYPIVVADSAFLRISLVIPGPDDIDLYLSNSEGTIIAASTNGGTDELIELVLPADDTYTLAVHGWSVPSAPLAYAVDTWSVPLTPGTGPLVIDSAPATATLGATGTIDVSWSGLATGSYLGAVSHADDAGLIGLTLVSVDAP